MFSRRSFVAGTALAAGNVLVSGAAPLPARRLPLAFLGAGYSHFAGKYQVATESPEFEVIGVCEEDAAVRGTVAKPPRWISFEELVQRSEVVVVESEVRRHAADALRALEAGKHVHVEKPPAETMSGFDALLAAASRQKRLLQVGYMWRFNPGLVALLKAARAGAFGEIFMVRATMNTLAGPAERRLWAGFAGGAMFEQGCHLVDAVVRLLGRPSRVTPFLQQLGRPGDDLADNAVAVLEFPAAMAVISSAPRQPGAGPHRFFEVTGTLGTGRLQPLEPPRLVLDLSEAGAGYPAGHQEIPLPAYRRYGDDFAALAAAIRGGTPLSVPPETERVVQETVLRACGMA
jgi:predicted dehydrogenase